MDIIIQSPGFKASEALEAFIQERVSKLADYGARIIRADVTLVRGSKRNPEDSYCEIRLEIPGNDLFVKKNNSVFETAIADAVEALQTMILRNKEKKIDNRRQD